MDRLNQVASYFNEKERKRLDAQAEKNSDGLPEMTFDEIKFSCVENNGYETPELNEKIYLHFRGFRKIENLDQFTACKALWLDSNGFSTIENLDCLLELRCLYLSKNLISRIENLDSLQHLTILDLSNNRISKITNLSCCANLQTLNVAHNCLSDADSIAHLQQCALLNNVDLTNNRLESNEELFNVLKNIPSLVALSVNGNDITKVPSFRKKMLSLMPNLGYLDRPVDPQEKIFAAAFMSGGAEAEKAAREQWKIEQEVKRVTELNEFKAWQQEQRKLREAAKAEGRSLITEFTAEEQQQRRAEAEAAGEAERRMLEGGIGKLAAKYWQVEASCKGEDPLEVAAQQLLAEQQQQEQESRDKENATEQRVTELDDVEVELDDFEVATAVAATAVAVAASSPSKSSEGDIAADGVDGDDEAAAAAVEESEVEDPFFASTAAEEFKSGFNSPARPTSDDTAAAADASAVAVRIAAKEREEQQIREERVAESFYIYKKQREAEKKGLTGTTYTVTSCASSAGGGSGQTTLTTTTAHSSTWNGPFRSDDSDRPLFWSESMDINLAKLVKACKFDFDDIAMKMQQLARDAALANETVHRCPDRLSSEACRLRWAHLDAGQWSEVNPNTSALDTNFKVCINPAVLGAGHGAQPSFEALASMTAGTAPTYLTVPTKFPTVQDMDGDSDLDLD